MYCCGSEGASQASVAWPCCQCGGTGPQLQAWCWTRSLSPHHRGWVLSMAGVLAVNPSRCSHTSSRDLMRVLMNLCPSFPSIMLLRIWGTQRMQLRATGPGHVPTGTHPSRVALGPVGCRGEQPRGLWGKGREARGCRWHWAGTQGTVTQLLSPPWPHGSYAGALRMRHFPGQARESE